MLTLFTVIHFILANRLYISSVGAHSTTLVTIRPNLGRRTAEKYDIRQKINGGTLASVGVDEAMEIWKHEFELADISSNENYQFSCPGGHKEVRTRNS